MLTLTKLINPKLLSGMFNQTVDLSWVELKQLTFCRQSTLAISFASHRLPAQVPSKWAKIPHNALMIHLELWGIDTLQLTGCQLDFFCCPTLSEEAERITLQIAHEALELSCTAEFLYIVGITPYLDERWD